MVDEVPAAGDSALVQLVDQALVQLDSHAAPLSDAGVMKQADHAVVARVDKPLKPKRELVEVLGPSAHELREALPAPIDL